MWWSAAAAGSVALSPASTYAAPLEVDFADPPAAARPRVWWHWMNGNVTKDGIAKDLAWMTRVGIGGLQAFDADISTPKVVDDRLVYMTPAWKDAFRTAATIADKDGLELAIASSPGWSETGGPWVKPADAMKKLVWSATFVSGGKPAHIVLPAPPTQTGPFQAMRKSADAAGLLSSGMKGPPPTFYADVSVLAFPGRDRHLDAPQIRTIGGDAVDPSLLTDGDPKTATPFTPSAGKPSGLIVAYPKAQTVRSAVVLIPVGPHARGTPGGR
jgi:hypothetical protein